MTTPDLPTAARALLDAVLRYRTPDNIVKASLRGDIYGMNESFAEIRDTADALRLALARPDPAPMGGGEAFSRRDMIDAYLTGFDSSGEGWNGEYPLEGQSRDSSDWTVIKERAELYLAARPPSDPPAVSGEEKP
jgi:hypothetical protein